MSTETRDLAERLERIECAAAHFADKYELLHSSAVFGRVTSGELQGACREAAATIRTLEVALQTVTNDYGELYLRQQNLAENLAGVRARNEAAEAELAHLRATPTPQTEGEREALIDGLRYFLASFPKNASPHHRETGSRYLLLTEPEGRMFLALLTASPVRTEAEPPLTFCETEDRAGGYSCTLPAGHDGEHVAEGAGWKELARWPSAAPRSAEPQPSLADEWVWEPEPFVGMVVCPECGNKRCPKARDDRNDCTGSNARNQRGSAEPEPFEFFERFEAPMACRHPLSEVVSSDEGTAYCAACERESREGRRG